MIRNLCAHVSLRTTQLPQSAFRYASTFNPSSSSYHTPVMLDECMEHLAVAPGKLFVDCTLGGGGHTERILQLGGKVIGIDRDRDAIAAASRRLTQYLAPPSGGGDSAGGTGATLSIVHGSFGDIARIVHSNALYRQHIAASAGAGVDGVLADLGVSSHQLDRGSRGFSHSADGPLDMRMDYDNSSSGGCLPEGGSGDSAVSARDIINGYSVERLADVLFRYGDERRSRQIARDIVAARPISTTLQLRNAIVGSGGAGTNGRLSVIATKTLSRCFQAIRIAVNDEVGQLEGMLGAMLLRPGRNVLGTDVYTSAGTGGGFMREAGGRLCVLSYHSLEDRVVKHWFKRSAALRGGGGGGVGARRERHMVKVNTDDGGRGEASGAVHWVDALKIAGATKGILLPSAAEVEVNGRSRSAKLRCFESAGR